jgi:hypothetical protein
MESLEGRALLANISPSAVISSTPDGPNFDYSIMLTNPSSSDSAIGTFWYAWIAVPDQDYLATRPISVTPPAGWTDTITHHASGSDGYGILFTASSAASAVAPGSSLTFQFTSADPPSSVNGNSPFYPTTQVNTSVVYPQGPFSDAGHQFVVATASTPTPTPTSTPPVQITGVRIVQNKRHMATQIVVSFTGEVNAAEAQSLGIYGLTVAGKKNSFVARNAKHLSLRSAAYDASLHQVTLTPSKPFALKKSVELVVHGKPPGGLQDTIGRFIDGGGSGSGVDDGKFVIGRSGASRE